MDNSKQNILNRLKTIKGHIAGIEKMVEEDKPCSEVLMQISAVKSSVHKVGMAAIEQNAIHCLQGDKLDAATRREMERILKLVLDYTK